MVLPLFALLVAGSAQADPDRTGSPHFFVKDRSAAESLPLEETRTKVSIAGVIAHVRVTQVYKNEGAQPIEAVYVFPGSTRAAVFGMEMRIGERTIVAEIAKKADARAKYERAKEEGKAASLLEQERPNVFQMNVANIMPGDRIEVMLDYSELLVPESGVYELVVPAVVGPRYTGESEKQEAWTANPHLTANEKPPYRWSISTRISAGMPIGAVSSPSHRISPRFDASGTSEIETLDEDGGNRDFVLRYRLDGDRIETGLLLHQSEKEQFFTAIVQPPRRVAPSMIPPREYLFVVDVSGSMSGYPLDTAKELMKRLLQNLRSEDRFNVLTFAGSSSVMADASVPADRANLERALRLVNGLSAGGSTEMLGALRRALSMPRSSEMSATIVVITDGYVSVEKETFTLIRESLGEANLFAFGIGSSVNRHLIEGLARQGMGEPFVVLSPQDAPKMAQRLAEYVATPVLTNVKVAFDGFDAYDVEPKHVPDLFGERPLVIMGKYRGAPKGVIRISGTTGEGSFEDTIQVEAHRPSDDLSALPYLWARDRIARLSDFAIVGESHEREVTQLGLRYSLMTEFTSFVAVDSIVRNTDGKRVTVRQPLPMPEGVSNDAIGGAYGRSAGATGQAFGMLGTGVGGGGLGTKGGEGRFGKKGRDLEIRNGSPLIMGSLDREVIRRVIRKNVARLSACYEKQLTKNPSLAGRVQVEFTIAADGTVAYPRVSSSTLGDAEVERCLVAVLRSLRFSKPAGGGIVIVRYPFTFNTR